MRGHHSISEVMLCLHNINIVAELVMSSALPGTQQPPSKFEAPGQIFIVREASYQRQSLQSLQTNVFTLFLDRDCLMLICIQQLDSFSSLPAITICPP